ncbi:hypothetical protein ACFSLT_10765 [Novosphingobium resinovorum]
MEPGLHAPAQPGRHLHAVADPGRPDLPRFRQPGTCRILSFTTQAALSGTVDAMPRPNGHNECDTNDLGIALGEDFSIVFSAERPAGYEGHWAPIDRSARGMFTRFRMYHWEREVDPVLSIECLDPVPPKPRLAPEEILRRIGEMAKLPRRKTDLYYPMQNGVKDRVGFNVFEPVRYPGALVKQTYWPACFQLEDDEALIIETEIPARAPYWNVQLNDPYFNALEYVYRLSSTNGAMARLSSDGKFRAVIALTDPGCPTGSTPQATTKAASTAAGTIATASRCPRSPASGWRSCAPICPRTLPWSPRPSAPRRSAAASPRASGGGAGERLSDGPRLRSARNLPPCARPVARYRHRRDR